jgi:phosphatidate cytidylyltransferase
LTQEKKKPSDLLLRFVVGIPVGALFVCLFAFGNMSLLIGVLIATWISMREFWRITGVRNANALLSLPRLGELAALLLVWSAWAMPEGSLEVLLAIFLPACFIMQLYVKAKSGEAFLYDVAQVVLGILYIGGFLGFIFRLRHLQDSLVSLGIISFAHGFFTNPHMYHLPIYAVLISWCYDTSAFFAGKYFGKGKLAPTISPNKTILGLVGGLVGSTTGVLVYSWIIGLIPDIALWKLVAFGVAGGAISQLGDLTVSALKRETKQKDTGKVLGAHGGMLDRIDGFLFALPVTYLFFLMILGL